MSSASHTPRPNLWPELALLLAGAWLRLTHLAHMPMHWDEWFHLEMTWQVQHGNTYAVLPFARWLSVAVMALFDPTGPEAIWLTRALTAVGSVIAIAAAGWFGRWLGGRAHGVLTGRIAMLTYLLMPFAVFYERQNLSDTWMAFFGAAALVAALRLIRTRRLWLVGLTVLLLAAAILSKFSGILLAPAVVLAALWLPATWRARGHALALVSAVGVITLVLGLAVYAGARQAGVFQGGGLGIDAYRWCHGPACSEDAAALDTLTVLRTNARIYLSGVNGLITWPVWLLAVGSALAAWFHRPRWKQVAWLWLPAFALVLVFATSRQLPARYYLSAAVPLAALAAWSAVRAWLAARPALDQRPAPQRYGGPVIALVLMLVPAAIETTRIIYAPETAALSSYERSQYQAGWPGGWGAALARDDLLAWVDQHAGGRRVNVLVWGEASMHIRGAWPMRNGVTLEYADSAEQAGVVAEWLASGDPLLVIDEPPRYDISQSAMAAYGLDLTLVSDHAVPGSQDYPNVFGPQGSTIRLWRVAGARGDMAETLYTRVVGDPATYAGELAQVAQAASPDRPLLVFPAHVAPVLAASASDALDIRPVSPAWPPNPGEIATMTAGLETFDVLLWLPQLADNERELERWLYQNAFLTGEQWFGPMQLLHFERVTIEATPAFEATFGNQISLLAAGLRDNTVPAGEPAYIALHWQALTAIDADYNLFVHVTDANGNMIAQRDAVPLNGLAPTSSWAAMQRYTDHLLVAIPPETPGGFYTLHIGWYDPVAGPRLTLEDGSHAYRLRFVVVTE